MKEGDLKHLRSMMIKEFEKKEKVGKIMEGLRLMDTPELSLGPSSSSFADSGNSSSSSMEYDVNSSRKRKQPTTQTSIELQLNQPLPWDWEQCLDLQSGRMYYMNKKTMKKCWMRPKESKLLDLDLNISTFSPTSASDQITTPLPPPPPQSPKVAGASNMVAVACVNCHLLVMLCRSSPSCPNCKFIHTLLPSSPRKVQQPTKPLETLNLLH